MNMPVGVLLLRASKSYWSEADSIVPMGAYSTSRQVLDIAGRLKVQAWADYDTALLLRHLDPVVYVLLLLMTGMLMWIWPSRKKSVDEMEETTEEISQGIWIDLEKQELTIDGVSCSIAKLDLQLLSMLCEQQGECLTREEIKHKFWPTDDNAGEKIDTHIKTIRKMLKDFPRYQVVTVRGKGYYLQEIK
jgi:DNA-binding response OmpR family regulator